MTAPVVARPNIRPKRGWKTWWGALWIVVVLGVVVYFHFVVPPFIAVPTGSMVPALHIGDLAIVRPITAAQVRVGEIIVVHLPPSIQQFYHYPPSVIHRIIRITHQNGHEAFRTKGDANPYPDPYVVEPSYVRGIVVHAYRYWGYPILFLHSIQGRLFLLATLMVAVANAVWQQWEQRKRAQGPSTRPVPSGGGEASGSTERHPEPNSDGERLAVLRSIQHELQGHAQLLEQVASELSALRQQSQSSNQFLFSLLWQAQARSQKNRRASSNETESDP